MSISTDDVKHIARLARIELRDDELEKFRTDINKVLGYIEVLKTVDTAGVEPLAQVTGLENAFREDKVEESGLEKKIVKNAPESEGRFIKVKKVF
ncbi:MAG: Asp-tRNA(Asn)/Glu-tRNA(Gln) amidotransferase subunit GatC [bacterium]|nr:Asp-tRNA(Asn)/Glu-tRNA(Gln) amidotransferase subunit GatC [bacterium]MDZ4346888.1 Asp-tRNA(Asn)/Glu-tRNA(Gln) amidotransferase subunit GatC [Candidatus Binatia bacterium]